MDGTSGDLLIVPYGIETFESNLTAFTRGPLIVPYGIETKFVLTWRMKIALLIVPYGIETNGTYW